MSEVNREPGCARPHSHCQDWTLCSERDGKLVQGLTQTDDKVRFTTAAMLRAD